MQSRCFRCQNALSTDQDWQDRTDIAARKEIYETILSIHFCDLQPYLYSENIYYCAGRARRCMYVLPKDFIIKIVRYCIIFADN